MVEQIQRAYRTIFWATLLITLHFRINGLDLLPDWLGLVMAAFAFGTLAGYARAFRIAQVLAFILLLAPFVSFGSSGMGESIFRSIVLPLDGAHEASDSVGAAARTLLHILMDLCFFSGTLQLAVRAGATGLAEQAHRWRIWYALLMGTVLLLPRTPLDPVLMVAAVLAAGLGAGLLVLLLARRTSKVEMPDMLQPLPPLLGAYNTRKTRLLILLSLLMLAGGVAYADAHVPYSVHQVLGVEGDTWVIDWSGRVAFSPDGRQLAVTTDRGVDEWDIATKTKVNSTAPSSTDFAFSPDRQRVVIGGWNAGIYDVKSGALIDPLVLDETNKEGVLASPHLVEWSPDGRYIAIGHYLVAILDATTGERLHMIFSTGNGHTGDARAIAFSPDSRLLATGGQDGAVRLWDVETGALVKTLQTSGQLITEVAFSPDGSLIASADDYNFVSLWDARTGERVRRIVVTSRIERLLGRRPHAHFRDHTTAVAFSPDGTLLATGSSDGTAGLWEVASGRRLATISGHSNYVIGVAISPDNTHVATFSTDRTARVWALEK